MKKWHIEVSATVTRVYEVETEAESKAEAIDIFRNTDEPTLIMEEEVTSEIVDVSAAD